MVLLVKRNLYYKTWPSRKLKFEKKGVLHLSTVTQREESIQIETVRTGYSVKIEKWESVILEFGSEVERKRFTQDSGYKSVPNFRVEIRL